MELLLGLFDNSKPLEDIAKNTSEEKLDSTIISVCENEEQLRFHIEFGRIDQDTAENIYELRRSRPRFKQPESPEYDLIVNYVHKLQSPTSYHVPKLYAAQGYVLGHDTLQELLDSSQKVHFSHLFLQNMRRSFTHEGMYFAATHIVFSKL